MSVINFQCDKEFIQELKTGVWEIIRQHYLDSVSPHTMDNVEKESKETYIERLDALMQKELCKISETEDGVCVEFDSTEDAGFSIGDEVYKAGPRYNDNGLTYLNPLFESIIEKFPDVCFNAYCECYDNWVSEEYHCCYDGNEFSSENEEEW